MTVIRFIGDIHGKFMTYRNLLEGVYGIDPAVKSVQIGDYGLGFDPFVDERQIGWAAENSQHRFIRGNHDNIDVCRKSEAFIPDMSYSSDGVFYLGGAWSIDKDYRIAGRDWWPTEELSMSELEQAIDMYQDLRPKIVVTHDCPHNVAWEMFLKQQTNPWHARTRTGMALQEMFDSWKPELHIFGHWHQTKVSNIDGTTFVCLGELAYMDVDLETAEIITWPRFRNQAGHWVELPKSDNY